MPSKDARGARAVTGGAPWVAQAQRRRRRRVSDTNQTASAASTQGNRRGRRATTATTAKSRIARGQLTRSMGAHDTAYPPRAGACGPARVRPRGAPPPRDERLVSYPAWKGRFYPAALPASRMLAAYAARLPAVEVNATFYRMPQPRDARRLARAGARGLRLRAQGAAAGDAREAARRAPRRRSPSSTRAAAELGGALGPVLWQLPPSLAQGPARASATSSRSCRAAAARRSSSATRAGSRTTCSPRSPTPARRSASPTTRRASTPARRHRAASATCACAARTTTTRRSRAGPSGCAAQRWEDAFVFFKHEDEARGPDYALRFGARSPRAPRASRRRSVRCRLQSGREAPPPVRRPAPERAGPRRWAVLAMLVVGGLVALLVADRLRGHALRLLRGG